MKDPRYVGDWFEELVNSVKSTPVNNHDKRVSPRVGMSLTVDLCDMRTGKPVRVGPVRLRDVSRTGVGFIFPRQIKTGMEFCLSFPRNYSAPLLIGYQCVHCRSVSERLFTIGAALLWIGSPPASKEGDNQPGESEEVRRIRNAMLR
ncbi:MAG TPA: PilZ domain-containing protein [Tepidisphaeraceae bacterium]|nr:PilZ domain-containing protein [Tepidisphaeraceae bacterium]